MEVADTSIVNNAQTRPWFDRALDLVLAGGTQWIDNEILEDQLKLVARLNSPGVDPGQQRIDAVDANPKKQESAIDALASSPLAVGGLVAFSALLIFLAIK